MLKLALLLTQVLFAAPQTKNINGDYVKACHLMEDDSLITNLSIQDTRWTFSHVAYEDDKCTKAYLVYELQYKVKAVDRFIDMTTVQATYTSLTDGVTEALNMINWCGFSDWKTGTARTVNGLVCDEYKVPDEGEILYSTYQVKAKEPLQIFMGTASSDLDGKTPQSRYQLTERFPFEKHATYQAE
ncbi:hypothetical protein ACLVWU_04935 [Bdellovibrio sp. HCB290]|uniref:hypothetical protein n=1 Tax=Bdellovibrio sp. HCB290 TaxID=3394356 RepID=UPI0039B4B5A4